jgi:hypothetical protein
LHRLQAVALFQLGYSKSCSVEPADKQKDFEMFGLSTIKNKVGRNPVFDEKHLQFP